MSTTDKLAKALAILKPIDFLRDPAAWLKRRRELLHYRHLERARRIGRRWAESAILEGAHPEHVCAIAGMRLTHERCAYEREHLNAAISFASDVLNRYPEREYRVRVIK